MTTSLSLTHAWKLKCFAFSLRNMWIESNYYHPTKACDKETFPSFFVHQGRSNNCACNKIKHQSETISCLWELHDIKILGWKILTKNIWCTNQCTCCNIRSNSSTAENRSWIIDHCIYSCQLLEQEKCCPYTDHCNKEYFIKCYTNSLSMNQLWNKLKSW